MKKLNSVLISAAMIGSTTAVMAHPGHEEGIHAYLHAEHLVILAVLAVVGWLANRIYKKYK